MSESLFLQVGGSFFAIILLLVRLVYSNLNDKLRSIENKVCAVPTNRLESDIASMKNDIMWLKDYLVKKI